jgi:histone arginine demethylase JMJD6
MYSSISNQGKVSEVMTVDRRQNLSLEEFQEEYARPGKPVIITDATEGWDALKWTPEYLASVAPDAEVSAVSTSAKTLGAAVKMTLKEYTEYFQAPDERKLYMINWAFEKDNPELLDGFEIPVYFKDDWLKELSKPLHLMWLFLGPSDSGLFMHLDVGHTAAWNAQLSGNKLWKLWAPGQDECLYGGKVDAFDPDLESYPRFRDAQTLDCVVEAGECIFIPSLWWHQTKNKEAGLALTANYVDRTNHTMSLDYLKHVPEYDGVYRELRRIARRKLRSFAV